MSISFDTSSSRASSSSSGHAHVQLFREFVALHQLAPIDDLVADGAEGLVLDPAAALAMEEVKRHPFGDRRGKELDQDGDQPE
jgi:hypothetical protein